MFVIVVVLVGLPIIVVHVVHFIVGALDVPAALTGLAVVAVIGAVEKIFFIISSLIFSHSVIIVFNPSEAVLIVVLVVVIFSIVIKLSISDK